MTRLSVRVTPRGGRDAVDRFDAACILHVRVAAAPTDGEATEAVRRLLAKTLGVPARDVMLVSGATSRTKTFDIDLPDDVMILKLETFT